MKYLVIESYTPVAIPLEALGVGGGPRVVSSKYMNEDLLFFDTGKSVTGRIVDEKQILDKEPADEAPAI